ncbi:MAG: VOC family protein [Acidobacteria bacterium]|nr:MAG: VOC family protein [Acidobacteriota bacterium]
MPEPGVPARRAPIPYGIPPDGYRLSDETRVGAVRLQVSDLERSVEFYRAVLGLRVVNTETTAGKTVRALTPHEGQRPIIYLRSREGVIPPPRRGAFGLFHFAVRLPDRAALGRFVAHLSDLGAAFGAGDHLVSEAIYLHDPDGLGIEVYSDRPREAWEHLDGQLVMATEPLDIDGLRRAGRPGAWEGSPAGTVIGHIHLHVGSLADAEAFYHSGLGLDKTVWNYPGALFFSAGGYHHHLGTNTWSAGPSPQPHHAQLLEWELIVPRRDDAAAAARSLRAAGYDADEAENAWTTADPWGTRLRIVSER